MIQATSMLVKDVRCGIHEATGQRVTLAALKLIHRVSNGADTDIRVLGDIMREKLDPKPNTKLTCSERVDMVLYGKRGRIKKATKR